MIFKIFLETVFRQKLIKDDAGEAWDPSRKMRLENAAGIIVERPHTISFKWFDDDFPMCRK